MDPITRTLLDTIERLRSTAPSLEEQLDAITASLTSAPRIVIVGRLKAGKSTLVNALIGSPASETAALEATNVVTVFEYGAPDRAVAHLLNGESIAINTKRGQVAELPADARSINYVRRWMPAAPLRDYSLIDTPGLATLTEDNERATRRALIEGYEQTKNASVDADAAIFLFDTTPRRDEVEFLTSLGFTPLNTLGVLSRADGFAQGALGDRDPFEQACVHAETIAGELKQYLTTVVPVAGLLAETSHTGALTENDARDIARFSQRDDIDLLRGLLGTVEEADGGIERIVKLIGEYGLFRGRATAAHGAAALNDWLIEASRLPQLKDIINRTITPYARLHRAGRIIAGLEQLAYSHPEHREAVRNASHDLRQHEALQPAILLMDLKAVLKENPDSELVDMLLPLITGYYPADKMGLDRYASGYDIIEAVRQARVTLQGLTFSVGPAEEAAMITINRALDAVERAGEALT
ncbi:GTPase [Corynebacterium aquilae]|uniref:G domain-containing protein n=1 Tax=Corynebacterium aquilae DSM 44791 TaxID=1431546 RepID=A0A1L7CDH1_9CORY|nr:GTPase [Corynebacterium aquilae]APT83910.1 hypothetical protein CAQU_01145 [Corynebacterium aquilae DSM 44791]